MKNKSISNHLVVFALSALAITWFHLANSVSGWSPWFFVGFAAPVLLYYIKEGVGIATVNNPAAKWIIYALLVFNLALGVAVIRLSIDWVDIDWRSLGAGFIEFGLYFAALFIVKVYTANQAQTVKKTT